MMGWGEKGEEGEEGEGGQWGVLVVLVGGEEGGEGGEGGRGCRGWGLRSRLGSCIRSTRASERHGGNVSVDIGNGI